MKNKYSKPVLMGDDWSSYKPEIEYELEITNTEEAMKENGEIELKIRVDLSSTMLKNLIAADKASIGIKVKTGYFIKYYKINVDDSMHIITVDSKDLKPDDSIQCTSYVVANEDLTIPYSDEMNDDYAGYEFKFHHNEVLAESSTDKIYYKASGEPFIQINRIENKTDIGFSLKENIISVNVGDELNIALTKLQDESKKVCPGGIINSFIAFNAIFYALLKSIVDGVEKYSEKEWFIALDANYEGNLKEYLESMSGENLSELDIDGLVELVQKMIKNQLNNKVVEALEVANGNNIKKN